MKMHSFWFAKLKKMRAQETGGFYCSFSIKLIILELKFYLESKS